jgi:hypothetical protein
VPLVLVCPAGGAATGEDDVVDDSFAPAQAALKTMRRSHKNTEMFRGSKMEDRRLQQRSSILDPRSSILDPSSPWALWPFFFENMTKLL